MAAVTSLGIHTPVAVPYLVAEGLLPPNPGADLFQWETYVSHIDGEDVEEEVLATRSAVVWSQGNFIRNVYRFELEGENVVQALLSSFPSGSRTQSEAERISKTQRAPRKRLKNAAGSHESSCKPGRPDVERALVVLLRSKAHIHFLCGANHIVNLPFEVERAFPAPRGIVLQRQSVGASSFQASLRGPAAPPNSFLSPHPLGVQRSYLSSPTLPKTSTSTRPVQPSPLGGDTSLNALLQSLAGTAEKESDEDVTNIYTLSGALSDLGVVTYSVQRHKPVRSGKQTNLHVNFEGLDSAERIMYVSAKDELGQYTKTDRDALILIATFNANLKTVSLWHAWYVEEQSLKTLLKMRTEQKAHKARRRSSFLSTTAGTGTATPAIRRRDAPRESFGGAFHPEGSQGNAPARKPTKKEEEESMAAQMDPDYRATEPQQAARDGNRRVSSMNADTRASQTTLGASFVSAVGRRHTSFGGQQGGRRSLGHRKSRASIMSNVFSQGLGTDDDTMDVDSTIELDPDESFDTVLQHIRNTFDVCGIDTVFGSAEEGFKRDIVVRKLHCFDVFQQDDARASSLNEAMSGLKMATMSEAPSISGAEDTRLRVYLHNRQSGGVQYITLKIKYRALCPELPGFPIIPIPVLVGESQLASCDDMMKLQDGSLAAILFGSRGVQFSLDEQIPCPLLFDAPYRAHNILGLMPQGGRSNQMGRNRLLTAPNPPFNLQHRGSDGAYDIVGSDGVNHRRKLLLRPSEQRVDKLITLCELMLPKQQARTVRKIWSMAFAWLKQHTLSLENTSSDRDFVALTATIFTFVLPMLDDKARAAINVAGVAMSKHRTAPTSDRSLLNDAQGLLSTSSAWSWLPPSQGTRQSTSPRSRETRKDQLLVVASVIADELISSGVQEAHRTDTCTSNAIKLMLGLHVLREEQSLTRLVDGEGCESQLMPIIAQLGSWLGSQEWSLIADVQIGMTDIKDSRWACIKSRPSTPADLSIMPRATSVYQWFEVSLAQPAPDHFISLSTIAHAGFDKITARVSEDTARALTPRLTALSNLLVLTKGLTLESSKIVELLAENKFSFMNIEAMPEAIAAPFMDAIARCERQPPTTWRNEQLRLIGRTDLILHERGRSNLPANTAGLSAASTRDALSVCHATEHSTIHAKTKEAGRHAITQLIFSEDRRMVEAMSLMHFNTVQIGWCAKEDEWDEQKHFDMQRRIMHYVTTRMIALPSGDGMIHYDSQTPLLTEKYNTPGFNSSCLMQPMGHTLTADRAGLSEEKVNWAYFHAGVSVGIRISKGVRGIDTSWIAFNKPSELTNRHAGLLLALGLSGHLRHLAKWLSFKYLTPKHTMTSIGLLLGLSASYIGTMDALITKMLSVHITKMLPPGAADVNVSPATQTAGLMGIGLLYYNTQHRRMSEIMLSEIEYMEVEDPDSGPDPLRDESYRLAAGFALGLINLGKGNELRGLCGMQLADRLLAMAVGPRPINAVHVFDRATAGAVLALALVYMKSGEKSVSSKVDIPDTETQFDHVRPDVLMLRAVAKHIILWESIQVRIDLKAGIAQESLEGGEVSVHTFEKGWIGANLPRCYSHERLQGIYRTNTRKHQHDSAHIPLYYVLAGLAWALGLKYAGSGNLIARDELLSLLKWYNAMNNGAFWYDAKITRGALCRCQDVVAIAASVVMAGTGDLEVYRFLRPMHARLDPQTPYGSHMAAHTAIGILFLAGGTYTFGTSDLAIAALMISLHPIWPVEVNDNRVHLQAFRHLWVLAAEARCIFVEDVDTQRPIHMPIKVALKSGEVRAMRAPCLLPEIDSVATIQTVDPAYWQVTLDFVSNPQHLEAFRKDQRVHVRRCPAGEAHDSVFSATLAALTDMSLSAQSSASATGHGVASQAPWHEVLSLSAFQNLDRADVDLLLPAEANSSIYMDERATAVDDRLVLGKCVESNRMDDLWNLRTLFAWAEREEDRTREGQGQGHAAEKPFKWLGRETLQELRAGIEDRARRNT